MDHGLKERAISLGWNNADRLRKKILTKLNLYSKTMELHFPRALPQFFVLSFTSFLAFAYFGWLLCQNDTLAAI